MGRLAATCDTLANSTYRICGIGDRNQELSTCPEAGDKAVGIGSKEGHGKGNELMGSGCKIIPVKNRLGELLRKPGGVARSEALEAAIRNIETLREEFVAAIPGEIAALETILDAAGRKHLSAADLDAMLRRADQLLTLSGTYGYDLLDQIVKRFCDLASGMIERNIEDAAPVEVHLRAMRLVCPGNPDLDDTESGHMLARLAAVRAHYGITTTQGE